ncbi:MAG: autotransporter outer membrane beta-barrel domain-containing protein, partial [Enterobacteriaceae bacterium]
MIDNFGTLHLDNSRIDTSADGSIGIWADKSKDIAIKNGTAIVTHGNVAYGVWLTNPTGGSFIMDNSSILTGGLRADGILADSGSIVRGINAQITTTGNNSHAINTQGTASFANSTLITKGSSSYVVNLGSRGEISFRDSILTAEGENASVIHATGYSTATASKITVTNSHLSAAHGNLIDAMGTRLNLTFSGNNQFDVPNGHLLHVAKDDTGQVSTVNVVLDNAPLLTGDMEAEDLDSTLNVLLKKGSAWKGSGHNVNNVTVDGSSAWHLSADSDVTQLAVSQGSYVNFVNRHEQYNTLTVRNDITGDGGTFRMHVSMEKQQGDQLRVGGHIHGQHTLSVDNNAAENTHGAEVHTVAVAQHADGNFKLEHLVEDGGYLYDLRKKSSGADTRAAGGESWELYGTQKVTSAANAAVNFISSAYLMQYAENQTLLQRMGDLHYGTQDNRLWGRGFVGRFDHFSSGKLDGFSMNYHGFQLGGDHKLEQTHGNLFLGVFASLGNSTQQQRPGDG